MRSVAVYSSERVGSAMAGPAIRYVELARALAQSFHVVFVAPDGSTEPEGLRLVRAPTDAGELASVLAGSDVVFAQLLPPATIRALARSRRPVVYDLYNPYVAEPLAQLDTQPAAAAKLFVEAILHAQRLALRTGAAFVCASERQRDLWLGVLAMYGRLEFDRYRDDPELRTLIDVVPFGLPAQPPSRGSAAVKGVVPGIESKDRLLVWGGGIWNWLDPLTPIRAVAALAERRGDVKLLFLGTRHPDPAFPETAMAQRAIALADELGLRDRYVFFNEQWVPYAERAQFLLEADVGVSAHFEILETRYAFRTRLLDYFWAALPMITTSGDVLADLVHERGLGAVVAPGDVAGWVEAIERVLRSPPPPHTSFASVRQELAWPHVAEPLVRIVGDAVAPARAPTLAFSPLQERWLRARTSVALGGVVARQAEKLRARLR